MTTARASSPPWVPRVLALVAMPVAVIAFSGGWSRGGLVVDGPGVSLYLRLVLEHLRQGGLPYWMPEMWAGAPIWALAPSFPSLLLTPLAAHVGPDEAVKMATLAAQVVGAWGAFALARSLWDRSVAPALVAGLAYGLHPLVVTYGALFGQEPSVWVMAATPWLAWSLRKGLRGDGPQFVALAGLVAAFAVLEQAEHAYGLVLLAGCLLAVELGRARTTGTGFTGAAAVLVRASAVIGIGLGAIAFWLLPFLTMTRSFVLSPPGLVRLFLRDNTLARDPGLFLHRSGGLRGPVEFSEAAATLGTLGSYYLGWVPIVLTLVTIVLVARRDRDGTLTAILFASAVAVWMSTGAVPLAASGPAQRGQLVAFVVVGAVGGFLVSSFFRCLRLPWLARLGGPATALVLLGLPYLTPFLSLQRVVPFLSSIRFPRFYAIAALGLALGTVYPLTLVRAWAARREPRLAPLLGAAVSLAVAGAFLVDVHPYRSFYEVGPPGDRAFRAASTEMGRPRSGVRVANDYYGDPILVGRLLGSGRRLSVGWPHFLASRDLWPLTAEALTGPVGYRQAALGLSATEFVVNQRLSEPDDGTLRVVNVPVEKNPKLLPMVRAYEQAVVVRDRTIAPQLAIALSQRNVATVTGGQQEVRALGAMRAAVVEPPDACEAAASGRLFAGASGEVISACGMRHWVGYTVGHVPMGLGEVGAVFVSPQAGLRGVAVWLDRDPGAMQLVLHPLEADGRTFGPEVARATASRTDENGMALFTFDPLAASAGARYAFLTSCPTCIGGITPKLAKAVALDGKGNLVVGGELQPTRNAAFSLLYDRVPSAPKAATATLTTGRRAGRWEIATSGDRPSLVVVAESFFPGWQAEVDGKPAPVVMADGAFLGVAVGPGRHRVSLVYHRPGAALVGRVVTALTLGAALVLMVYPSVRRRRRARRPGVSARSGPRRTVVGSAGYALEVSAPAVEPVRKARLDPGGPYPRPAAGAGQRPGRERKEAVLALVDDLEPGAS